MYSPRQRALGLATVGMLIAIGADRDDYIGYGVVGGLAVASVIDAIWRTDEPSALRTAWVPQVQATHEGVRAGVAFAW